MTFRVGELVSLGPIQGLTIYGRVVQLTPRMLKIHIENGPRAGQLDWPDSPPWQLGLGLHESRCCECLRVFRTDYAADAFCPSCLAGDPAELQAQADDPSRRSSSWELAQRARQARGVK